MKTDGGVSSAGGAASELSRSDGADSPWTITFPDVAIVHWPEQAEAARQLDLEGVAHLLLVERVAVPPEARSCLEDWIRVPADNSEVRARLLALRRRRALHEAIPSVSEHGEISNADGSKYLSPLHQDLAELLTANFEEVVSTEVLGRVWQDGGTPERVRNQIGRLRRCIAPIGLTIRAVRGKGYVMSHGELAIHDTLASR